VSEAADITAAANDDVSFTEQCLGCESLMVQLRDISDEAHQLRIRLAELTEALQVTPAHSLHAPFLSLIDGFRHKLSLPRASRKQLNEEPPGYPGSVSKPIRREGESPSPSGRQRQSESILDRCALPHRASDTS